MPQYETLKKLAIWMGVVIVLLVFANIFVVIADIPQKDRGPDPVASGAPPSEVENAPQVGDTVTTVNWQYTVTEVERQKTLPWSGFENRAEAKGIWQVVFVTAKNVASQPQAISTLDFELRDAAGHGYTPDQGSLVWDDDNQLCQPGDRCPPGAAFTLGLVFDVDVKATGMTLYIAEANQAVDLGY